MVMSRRQFLGCAAGAITIALPTEGSPGNEPSVVTVLDLKQHCSLRESIAGYELASAGVVSRRPVLIVAAALALPAAATYQIAKFLRGGGTVLLESGAGFVGESGFRIHRDALRSQLQIRVEAARFKSRGVPYVDYAWPYPTKIRDFSRVVPVGDQPSGSPVDWAGAVPPDSSRCSGPTSTNPSNAVTSLSAYPGSRTRPRGVRGTLSHCLTSSSAKCSRCDPETPATSMALLICAAVVSRRSARRSPTTCSSP